MRRSVSAVALLLAGCAPRPSTPPRRPARRAAGERGDLIGLTAAELLGALRPSGASRSARATGSSCSFAARLRARRLSLSAGGGGARPRVAPCRYPPAATGDDIGSRRLRRASCSPAPKPSRAAQRGGVGDHRIVVAGSASTACRAAPRSPLLPAAIRQLRIIRATPDALDRRAREQRAEAGIVEREQIGERRRGQFGARAGRRDWPAPRRRSGSTGRPPGNRRSRRCGCRSPREIPAGSGPHARWSGRRCSAAHRSGRAVEGVGRAGVEAARARLRNAPAPAGRARTPAW